MFCGCQCCGAKDAGNLEPSKIPLSAAEEAGSANLDSKAIEKDGGEETINFDMMSTSYFDFELAELNRIRTKGGDRPRCNMFDIKGAKVAIDKDPSRGPENKASELPGQKPTPESVKEVEVEEAAKPVHLAEVPPSAEGEANIVGTWYYGTSDKSYKIGETLGKLTFEFNEREGELVVDGEWLVAMIPRATPKPAGFIGPIQMVHEESAVPYKSGESNDSKLLMCGREAYETIRLRYDAGTIISSFRDPYGTWSKDLIAKREALPDAAITETVYEMTFRNQAGVETVFNFAQCRFGMLYPPTVPIVVAKLTAGGYAQMLGVEAGMTLIKMDGVDVSSASGNFEDVNKLLRAAETKLKAEESARVTAATKAAEAAERAAEQAAEEAQDVDAIGENILFQEYDHENGRRVKL